MKQQEGQNLIEYILLVTAVLIVCIYFFTTGPMQQAVNNSLYMLSNKIDQFNSEIQFNNGT